LRRAGDVRHTIERGGAQREGGIGEVWAGEGGWRGPTGCRFLADDRQALCVSEGSGDGYFWYSSRSDDMIIPAGYNLAGPEVESALLADPAVKGCGAADKERGQVVKAFVVLQPGYTGDPAMVAALPRAETAKLQCFALRRLDA
jgi:2-aminobenzoate-CoA ligase